MVAWQRGATPSFPLPLAIGLESVCGYGSSAEGVVASSGGAWAPGIGMRHPSLSVSRLVVGRYEADSSLI